MNGSFYGNPGTTTSLMTVDEMQKLCDELRSSDLDLKVKIKTLMANLAIRLGDGDWRRGRAILIDALCPGLNLSEPAKPFLGVWGKG